MTPDVVYAAGVRDGLGQLACTMLGSILGVLVFDVGLTDEQILATCNDLIAQLRAAQKDPAAMTELANATATAIKSVSRT
jgi:hypothetical protein